MELPQKGQDVSESGFGNFPAIGGLMVSKIIVEENITPGFMYREKRTNPQDSGWRIFTGYESEEYMDNSDNFRIYNPTTILKIDHSIADILLKGIGSVYEKSEDASEWLRVTDFELEDDYMVIYQLSGQWTIEISNLFERQVEESGDLLYTTGDRSVRLTSWDESGKSQAELLKEYKEIAENRDQTHSRTEQIFNFEHNGVAKIGYLIREGDEKKRYNVIYGFSIVDNEVVLSALYFDEAEDVDWAIKIWTSIKMK